MIREFVMMPAFEKQWKSMGLSDDDLQRLQVELLINPQAGNVIEGTGGLRKIRFAFNGRGKRGSARVAYVDFTVHKQIYLIFAYSKNEQDNLSKEERNNIKKMIEHIEKTI